jgi:hypothetical protein
LRPVDAIWWRMAQPKRLADPTTALNSNLAFQGLTPKMERYCFLRFDGATQQAAYRQAYRPTSDNSAMIAQEANRLEHNPKIIARIAQMIDDRDSRQGIFSGVQPSREFVTTGLMRLATTAEKESVQLGAYVAIGKMVGIDMFRETTRVERVERTVEDVDRELRERLAALAPMIEGQATPVSSAPKPRADRRRKPVTKA